MAYHLTCKIEIGKYIFRYAESVQIQSSWQTLGDTCIIKLPNFKQNLEKHIQIGDAVKVYLGYDGNNNLEFEGYVSKIGASVPLEIFCEDKVFLLKRHTFEGRLFQNATLKQVLNELLQSLQTQTNTSLSITQKGLADIQLGNIRIGKASYAEILQKLKEEYLFVLYFRPEYLYSGLPYLEYEGESPEKLDFSKNIVDATSLSFRRKEEVKIKVKAVSFLPNNEKITVEAGDVDGELRTIFTRGETNAQKLKIWAEQQLQLLKYEGYSGNITTFGLPFLQHTHGIKIIDSHYPERSGVYIIDKVKTSFGVRGFRREIEIGKKIG
jgi:hypothetical protein